MTQYLFPLTPSPNEPALVVILNAHGNVAKASQILIHRHMLNEHGRMREITEQDLAHAELPEGLFFLPASQAVVALQVVGEQ